MLLPNFQVTVAGNEPMPVENSLCFYIDALPGLQHSTLVEQAVARSMMVEFLSTVRNGMYGGHTTSPFFERQKFMWRRATQLQRDTLSDKGFNYVGRIGQEAMLTTCLLSNGIPLIDMIELALMCDALVKIGEQYSEEMKKDSIEQTNHRICSAWYERRRELVAYHGRHIAVSEELHRAKNTLTFNFYSTPIFLKDQYPVKITFAPSLANRQMDIRITTSRVLVESLRNLFGMEKYLWIEE